MARRYIHRWLHKRVKPDRFFDLSPDMLFTTTLGGRFEPTNPAVASILGHRETDLLNLGILDLIQPEERTTAALRLAELSAGHPIAGLESRFRCADGSYKWVAWNSTPYLPDGLAYTVAHERSGKSLDTRCDSCLESTTDAFFAVDHAWRLVRVNHQAERLWMRNRVDLLGRNLWEVFPEAVGGPFYEMYQRVLRTGKPDRVEQVHPCAPHGRWFEAHASSSPEGLSVIFRDVTQRRQTDDRINRSIQEKEVLLREVHHRVKNNLQVICSMLRLQARQFSDETLQQALRDCRERVLAMAMLHDQLHRAKDLSNINLGEYIRNLAASLFCSYGVDSATIALEMDIEDITVAMDTAIPCGLIVNELVSNSLRHAFPEGRTGHISLALHTAAPGRAELTLGDDGQGFTEPERPANSRSLGLRLVDLLAEQLDAVMVRLDRAGTVYRLEFQATESRETESHG